MVHDGTLLDLDAAYELSLASYYSLQEQSLHPTCIVIPTSSSDVATAVFVLNTAYQLSMPGCNFAIRSGGYAIFIISLLVSLSLVQSYPSSWSC
jgi:hypothetical protein